MVFYVGINICGTICPYVLSISDKKALKRSVKILDKADSIPDEIFKGIEFFISGGDYSSNIGAKRIQFFQLSKAGRRRQTS